MPEELRASFSNKNFYIYTIYIVQNSLINVYIDYKSLLFYTYNTYIICILKTLIRLHIIIGWVYTLYMQVQYIVIKTLKRNYDQKKE